MGDGEWLGIRLDFRDDAVGAFEPAKVLRQLQRAFPDAEIDPTGHQQVRLLRELEFRSRGEKEQELRDKLICQSWGNDQTNGPTYRFAIPFPPGHRVGGNARRLSVSFTVPAGLPTAHRGRLLAFLESLRMGEPKLDG